MALCDVTKRKEPNGSSNDLSTPGQALFLFPGNDIFGPDQVSGLFGRLVTFSVSLFQLPFPFR